MENTLKSNLILPSMAYELDREEMSYVEGGYDNYTTYAGNEAIEKIATYLGKTAGSIITLVTSAAALCATSVTIAGALLAIEGFIGSMFYGITNLYNAISAITYYCKYGSFTERNYGWWIFDFTTVVGK